MDKLCLYGVSTEFHTLLHGKQIYMNFLTNLHGIRDNHKKITYTYELMKRYGICEYFEKRNLRDDYLKDAAISTDCRQQGNAYYGIKDFNNAFKSYNTALAYAPEYLNEYVFAIANRSALFLKCKFYTESLQDISTIKSKYPFPDKLNQRENYCRNELRNQQYENPNPEEYNDDDKDQDSNEFEVKLRYKKHEQIPFISSCLSISTDTKTSTSVVYTTKELLPGDIVSIEKPFCTILDDNYQSVCCENCNKNLIPLIPCPNCTIALFCSENCMNEAYETFHKYECPIIFTLKKTFHYVHLLAIRITLVALHVFRDIKEFKNMLISLRRSLNNSTIFDFDFKTTSPATDDALSDDYVFDKKEQYKSIFCQTQNPDNSAPNERILHIIAAALICDLFFKKTPLNEIIQTIDDENIFKDFIFHNILVSQCVYRSIFQSTGENESSALRYAIGAFPFQGNIKFTCSNSSNVYPLFNGKKTYLLVTKRLLPNDILCDSSPSLHFGKYEANIPIEFRQFCNCGYCYIPVCGNYNYLPLSNETIYKIVIKPSRTKSKKAANEALELCKKYFDLGDFSQCNKTVMIRIFEVLLDVHDLNIAKRLPSYLDEVANLQKRIEVLNE